MKKIIGLITILSVILMLSGNVVAAPQFGKITFIHYKKAPAKVSAVCGNGICESGEAKKCPADCGRLSNKLLCSNSKWI